METKIKGFWDDQPSLCVQFRAQRLNDLTFLNNQEIARVMLAVRDYFFWCHQGRSYEGFKQDRAIGFY